MTSEEPSYFRSLNIRGCNKKRNGAFGNMTEMGSNSLLESNVDISDCGSTYLLSITLAACYVEVYKELSTYEH